MSSNLLVLLGNENEPNGELTIVAQSRAKYALEYLKEHSDYKVIPTGAFGEKFNRSSIPHGELLARYLIINGIDQDRILPFTRTSNTVEDAYGVLRAINVTPGIKEIHVVTSLFHMKRVKYIFGRALQGYKLEYHEVEDHTNDNKRRLDKDEEKKLEDLNKEWVDIANFDLNTSPEKYYENLGYEFRHYDNFSYLALVGAFISFGYSLSNNIIPLQLQYCFSAIVVVVFWYLYARLANTAAAVRRVMKAIEKLYKVPGLSSTKTLPPFGFDLKIKWLIGIIMIILIVVLTIKGISASNDAFQQVADQQSTVHKHDLALETIFD